MNLVAPLKLSDPCQSKHNKKQHKKGEKRSERGDWMTEAWLPLLKQQKIGLREKFRISKFAVFRLPGRAFGRMFNSGYLEIDLRGVMNSDDLINHSIVCNFGRSKNAACSLFFVVLFPGTHFKSP